MYSDNLYNFIEFQGHRSMVKIAWVWCCGYPRTVLSLEQGLMILFILSVCLSPGLHVQWKQFGKLWSTNEKPPNGLDLCPMTLKFNKVRAAVKVHVDAKISSS